MFATKQQREFLANAKSWYIEVTFKLCRHPFTQLVTVDAFVRKDDHAKLVLLLLVHMSEMSYASNNDTEGWHHGLNRRVSGRGKLLMYLLIQLLHRVAMLTAFQIRLVSEKKLKGMQRR